MNSAPRSDDVGKPFSYPEVHARIGALLRRARHRSRSGRIRIGPLELDALSRQARLNGSPIKLSKKEFALLRALAADPTRVFTYVKQDSPRVVQPSSRRTPGSPGRQTLSSNPNEAAGQDKWQGTTG